MSYNFHWQNLNDRPGGEGSGFVHGRAWLVDYEVRGGARPAFRVEWVHGGRTCGLTVDFDASDRSVCLHVAVPWLFSYFLEVEGLPAVIFPRRLFKWRRGQYEHQGLHRSVGVRIFDWAAWIDLWNDPEESRHGDPWYWRLILRPSKILDLLFGRQKFEKRILRELAVLVPMPERAYPGKAVEELSTWTRPRFPWRPLSERVVRVSVEVPGGVPVPGKGENAWDCGPDAIYAQSSSATTVEQAIANFTAAALCQRMKRGGSYEYSVGG